MAVSLNSVSIRLNPSARYEQFTQINSKVRLRKTPFNAAPLAGSVTLRQFGQGKRPRFNPLASEGDNVTRETTKRIETQEKPSPDDTPDAVSSSSTDDKVQVPPEASNSAAKATNTDQNGSSGKPSSTLKRSPLTARERLRAARVLSRYTESPKKPSKPELGSRLLDALQESDKGKRRPGLPEAPTNLFDDSKRGLPKEGWTFNFPGGMDVFFVVFSFVLISSLMFATTYIVWKVGAIHFNEY